MSTQIQVRRGTAANWSSTNPVLAQGEIGFETNTGLFKIGDGTLTYNALTYAGGTGGGGGGGTLNDLTDVVITSAASGDIVRHNGTAWVDAVGTAFFEAAGNAATAQAAAIAASQPLDSDLTAIAALTTTTYGRARLTDADAAALRTAAGVGTISTQAASAVAITGGTIVGITSIGVTGGTIAGITDLAVADGGTGASSAANARANLGLIIDTDITAKTTFDAHLADTGDAHDASAISVLDTAGNYTATDVEGVLVEQATKFASTTATINVQTGTTYTPVLTDENNEITMNNTSAQVLTVPPNASVPFTIGRGFGLTCLGTGDITITPGAGVTFVPTGDKLLFSVGQYADFLKIGTNTWSITLTGTNDAELIALAGIASAADLVPYFTGSGTAAGVPFTAAARTLVAATDAAGQRTAMGLIIGTDVAAPASRVTFSNAAYTVVASRSAFVAQTGTMSASRIVTLPAASAFRAGDTLTIYDESGTVTATNTIVITRVGGDTIAGGTTVTIAAAYGWRRLVSDGSSKWSFDGGVLRSASNLSDLTDAAAARTNLGLGNLAAATTLVEYIGVAVSDETTAITTGTAKVTFRMPFAMTVTAVRANVNTVSSSGTPTFDINDSGTTILSTKLTIDASEFTSTTAAVAAVISDSALADDAEITIDIDVAGTGAKGAKIWLIGTRVV